MNADTLHVGFFDVYESTSYFLMLQVNPSVNEDLFDLR